MVSGLRAALTASTISLFANAAPAAPVAPTEDEPRSDGRTTEAPSDELAGTASASDGARRAFRDGLEASRDERWPEAEAAFRRSLALVRRESTLYNLALAVYMEGRRDECASILEDALRDGGAAKDPEYEEYARRLLARVRAETSRVHLTVARPTALVRLDGSAQPGSGSERWFTVSPGSHEAEASAAGYHSRRFSFLAKAGIDVTESLALDAARGRARTPRAEPSSAGTLGPWITIGVGGALLAAAAVVGAVALETDDDLKSKCPTEHDCSPALMDERDRVVRLGHITDVLLISGGVVAAGGVAWRVLVPPPHAEDHGHAVLVEASGAF